MNKIAQISIIDCISFLMSLIIDAFNLRKLELSEGILRGPIIYKLLLRSYVESVLAQIGSFIFHTLWCKL